MALTATKQEQELYHDTKETIKSFNRDRKMQIKITRKEVKSLFRSCSNLTEDNLDQFELNYSRLRGWIENLQDLGGRVPKRWNRKINLLKDRFHRFISDIESELLEENDGGRKAAGHKGSVRDCVIRGLAIGTGIPYQQVWDYFNGECEPDQSPDDGNSNIIVLPYLERMGWMIEPWREEYGEYGETVAEVARAEGRLAIICCSRLDLSHLTVVADGKIHDTWNCGSLKVLWIAYPPNDEA